MADDVENDDQWLYGDHPEQETQVTETPKEAEPKLPVPNPDETILDPNDIEKMQVSFL